MYLPIIIAMLILTSFPVKVSCQLCGFIMQPTYLATENIGNTSCNKKTIYNSWQKSSFHPFLIHSFVGKGGKRASMTVRLSKVPNYYDIIKEKEIRDTDVGNEKVKTKRRIFKRLKEKILNTANGSNTDYSEGDKADLRNESIGYKPNILDAIRLRLAMAMSGLNNLNFIQRLQEEWVVACPKTRVGPGEIVPCEVNGIDVIIFASRDGKRLDAFANSCPHLGSPFDLATIERYPAIQNIGKEDDGIGDGCVDCIICPVHRTAFEIGSGNVSGEWCPHPPVLGGIMGYIRPKRGLVKFPVRLKGKNVEIQISNINAKEISQEGVDQ